MKPIPLYFKIYDTSDGKDQLLFAGTFMPEGDKTLTHEQHHAAIMHLVHTTTDSGKRHIIANTRMELLSEKEMGAEMDQVLQNKDESDYDIVRVVCPICFYLLKSSGKNTNPIVGTIREKIEKLTAFKDNKLQMETCAQHETEAKEQEGIYVLSTDISDVSKVGKVEFLHSISGIVAMHRDLVTIITGLVPVKDRYFLFCGNKEIKIMMKGRIAVADAVDALWDEIGSKISRQDLLTFYLKIKTAVDGLPVPAPTETPIPKPSTDTVH